MDDREDFKIVQSSNLPLVHLLWQRLSILSRCPKNFAQISQEILLRARSDHVNVKHTNVALTLYQIAFRSDVKKHLSVPFRNAIFRGIIATRCCFAQLLKDVHSVSDRCFFAPLRKAIRYRGNVA
jgi:hypothetical protein